MKPEAERARNYKNSASLIPERYESGINRAEWQGPALEGQQLYKTQMKKDSILDRREKGIQDVTDTEFRAAAISKGKGVIRERVEKAVDKQVAGYRPIAAAIESVTLEPLTDDIDTNIDRRVKPIAKAAHEASLSAKGYT